MTCSMFVFAYFFGFAGHLCIPITCCQIGKCFSICLCSLKVQGVELFWLLLLLLGCKSCCIYLKGWIAQGNFILSLTSSNISDRQQWRNSLFVMNAGHSCKQHILKLHNNQCILFQIHHIYLIFSIHSGK